MITDAIMGWFASALDYVLGLLPTWNPLGTALTDAATSVTGFAATLVGVVNWADFYGPAKLGITLLVTMWTLQAAIWLVNLVIWGIAKLHVFGGE